VAAEAGALRRKLGVQTKLLKALTVIHNYVITRRDGTTAAERFSGKKHEDLFAHLVAVTPPPARPRVRRRKERPPMLAAA